MGSSTPRLRCGGLWGNISAALAMSVQGERTRAAAMLAVGTPTHEAPCLLGVWVGDSVASNDAAAGRWRAWPRGGASSRFTYILAVYKCIAHPANHAAIGCVLGSTVVAAPTQEGVALDARTVAAGAAAAATPPSPSAQEVAAGVVCRPIQKPCGGSHEELSAPTVALAPRHFVRLGRGDVGDPGGGGGGGVALCLQLLRGKKVMPNALLEPLIRADLKGSAR